MIHKGLDMANEIVRKKEAALIDNENIEITVNNMIYDEPYITETNNVSEIPQIKQNLTLSACSL